MKDKKSGLFLHPNPLLITYKNKKENAYIKRFHTKYTS